MKIIEETPDRLTLAVGRAGLGVGAVWSLGCVAAVAALTLPVLAGRSAWSDPMGDEGCSRGLLAFVLTGLLAVGLVLALRTEYGTYTLDRRDGRLESRTRTLLSPPQARTVPFSDVAAVDVREDDENWAVQLRLRTGERLPATPLFAGDRRGVERVADRLRAFLGPAP